MTTWGIWTNGSSNSTASVSTDGTWVKWCCTTSASTTASVTAPTVWGNWCEGTTSYSTTATTNDATWIIWTTNATGEAENIQRSPPAYMGPPPETAEAKAERLALEKKAAEDHAQAIEKAEKLLVEHLNDDQKETYRKKKRFTVTSCKGTKYLVGSGRVKELDGKNRPVRDLCIHLDWPIPPPDNLLAQKLMIETNEDSFRRIANHTEIRDPDAAMEALGL